MAEYFLSSISANDSTSLTTNLERFSQFFGIRLSNTLIISADKSTPVILYPRFKNSRYKYPVPHPNSNISPFVGSINEHT